MPLAASLTARAAGSSTQVWIARYLSTPCFAELGLVFYRTLDPPQGVCANLNNPKSLIGTVFVLQLISPGAGEAKPRLITRIAQHHNPVITLRLAIAQPLRDQLRADALSLESWQDPDGSETETAERAQWGGSDRSRGE